MHNSNRSPDVRMHYVFTTCSPVRFLNFLPAITDQPCVHTPPSGSGLIHFVNTIVVAIIIIIAFCRYKFNLRKTVADQCSFDGYDYRLCGVSRSLCAATVLSPKEFRRQHRYLHRGGSQFFFIVCTEIV